jgi:protein-disulfide isomerase
MRIFIIGFILALATFLAPVPGDAKSDLPPVATMLADRSEGNPGAPVTIIEYSSLTCPHCAEFDEKTMPLLKKDYIDTGKVYFISRDFPLDKVALEAATMARCAPPENYFPLIDLLFKGQKSWALAADPVQGMSALGRFAGMSDSDIKDCLADEDLQQGIAAERADAESKYSVDGTPAFIFNNGAVKLSGADPYDKFKSTIDGLLAKK